MSRTRRVFFWAIGCVVSCAIVAGIWSAYVAIQLADHAERALHACILMTDVLEDYVIATDGRWPASWDDLQSTVPTFESRSMIYSWPKDRSDLEQFVTIDFAARPELLAVASPEDFKAIQPIGSCFESYNRDFPFLIDALRRTHHVTPPSPPPDAPSGSK